MNNPNIFDEISSKVSEFVNNSPAKDIEKNIKALVSSTFSKFDLVTREEFELQQQLIDHLRSQVMTLEQKLNTLEQGVSLVESSGLEDKHSDAD